MEEQHLSPLVATRESMREISGALIAIATVLAAVFIPMAFFGGSNGVLYRQFSITLVSAMALSVLLAFIFTPALCVRLLRRTSPPAAHRRAFFLSFHRAFDRHVRSYSGPIVMLCTRPVGNVRTYG